MSSALRRTFCEPINHKTVKNIESSQTPSPNIILQFQRHSDFDRGGMFLPGFTWIGKPFSGVLVYKFPHVGSFNCRDWYCVPADLKFMDTVKTVDGKKVRTGRDVVKLAETKNVGTPILFYINSKGVSRSTTL